VVGGSAVFGSENLGINGFYGIGIYIYQYLIKRDTNYGLICMFYRPRLREIIKESTKVIGSINYWIPVIPS
jgi:hypothetical protein